jgi:hypothetical protein
MPYIKQERRDQLLNNDFPENVGDNFAKNSGELNFYITMLIKEYLLTKGTSYEAINDILGALEGAKLEFYARVARPYEDTKIQENGDVY